MPGSGFVAGFAAGGELAAGGWAPFVNAASGFLPDGAGEGGAARAGVVGAAHAAGVVVDFVGQAGRDSAALGFGFVNREINAKARTAGAAGETGMGHGGICYCVKKLVKA